MGTPQQQPLLYFTLLYFQGVFFPISVQKSRLAMTLLISGHSASKPEMQWSTYAHL